MMTKEQISAEKTIAAISTPMGRSGMGIVRLSGQNVAQIIEKVFIFKGNAKTRDIKSHYAYYGSVRDLNDDVVDDAVMIFMKSPKSFTGEDMAEFTVHGSPVVLTKILEVFVQAGASLAQPGEFTKRAFLNKKIDLVQAEAIAELINSRSYLESRFARRRISGGVSDFTDRIKCDLRDLISGIEAQIDFPEEDLNFEDADKREKALSCIEASLRLLLKGYEKNCLARDGINITIAGEANAGKSTLFNALIKRNRAITSPKPGTTRDYLCEEMDFAQNRVKLFDTAGLNDLSTDEIEREGINKTLELMDNSDLVLFVMDGAEKKPLSSNIFKGVQNREVIYIMNKMDMAGGERKIQGDKAIDSLKISALRGDNFDKLEMAITSRLGDKITDYKDTLAISGLRQKKEIERAIEKMALARKSFEDESLSEVIVMDLKEAYKSILRLKGEDETELGEDILNNIFSNFCIGK